MICEASQPSQMGMLGETRVSLWAWSLDGQCSLEVHEHEVELRIFLHRSNGHPTMLNDGDAMRVLRQASLEEGRIDLLVLCERNEVSSIVAHLRPRSNYLDDEDPQRRL